MICYALCVSTSDFPATFDPADPSDAARIVRSAIRKFSSDIVLSCSFGGAGGMVLLDLALQVDPAIPVFVLDTGLLFRETNEFINLMEARYRVRVVRLSPDQTVAEQADSYGQALWSRQPDVCCELRKLRPLRRFLSGYRAWMTAIRRDQSPSRAQTPVVAWDEQFGLWKFCPLAHWSADQVADYLRAREIPTNPLLLAGYSSIGCEPCTSRPTGNDPRSGRWAGFAKTECGLHAQPTRSSWQRSPDGFI